MNNDAIESPKRTALIINLADHLGIDRSTIPDLIIDALEHDAIHPYDARPDIADPKITFIAMIESIIGYDDDHDDARHDLEHALDLIELCDDHGNCTTCCEPCLDL